MFHRKSFLQSVKRISSIFLMILSICEARIPAYRICKPGPAYTNTTLKKCLLIGDSVSIGYTSYVQKMLNGTCYVHHAPWDKANGGALDTKYILQCLQLFLSTSNGSQAYYDAIIFNSGLHDVNLSPGKSDEEYTPYNEYISNIQMIAKSLQKTGAKLGFLASTPVPFNLTTNNRIKQYNHGAKTILNSTGNVMFFDLYEKVVDICGEPPYNKCFITCEQPSPHYNSYGYEYLAVFVSKLFISLLKQPNSHQTKYNSKLSAKYEFKSQMRNIHQDEKWVTCKRSKHFPTKTKLWSHVASVCGENSTQHRYTEPKNTYTTAVTACPSTMTCCKHVYSETGLGCCVIDEAIACSDYLHCCPRGMVCSKTCEHGLYYCIPEGNKIQLSNTDHNT